MIAICGLPSCSSLINLNEHPKPLSGCVSTIVVGDKDKIKKNVFTGKYKERHVIQEKVSLNFLWVLTSH